MRCWRRKKQERKEWQCYVGEIKGGISVICSKGFFKKKSPKKYFVHFFLILVYPIKIVKWYQGHWKIYAKKYKTSNVAAVEFSVMKDPLGLSHVTGQS